MVAQPDDFGLAASVRPAPPPSAGEEASRWDLLGQLENAAIGSRAADGSISVRRSEPAGCVLYGPYLHLRQGQYRLRFRCRAMSPRFRAQPVLGVDVIVLSRFELVWRDFTITELAAGTGAIDFEVTPELSLEGQNEGRFEFRFFHLGNAGLAITDVELERLPLGEAQPLGHIYRLLGRLQKTWRGRRDADGSIHVGRLEPGGLVLYGGWPYLRLPRGAYRLIVRGGARAPSRPGRAAVRIEVFGQSRWRSKSWAMRLAPPRRSRGVELGSREVAAEEIAAGPVALDFVVPTEMAIEAGADAPFDIRLYHRGNAALTIDGVELLKLDDDLSAQLPGLPAGVAPRLPASGRHKVVLIGNCQMETVRQGFARVDVLNNRFEIKYHFVQLPQNLHDFALRDLESCDTVLAQDIRLWEEFPLRDRVRPGATILRFPLVRFASLWPFDTWNGPNDKEAYDREAPNLTFPYLDGLLGRLRKEIPDPEARFRAYRSLTFPGLVNYRRLHELEVRRLAAMDERFGITIGAYIIENFQKRRVFHTTVRPNWQVFTLLLQHVADLLEVKEKIALPKGADAMLRNPQVPIHPKVARDLGVKWVDDATRYIVRGQQMSWEAYVRAYIAHYG